MLGKGYSSPENFSRFSKGARWQKICTKRDADDNKRVSMTMNEGKGSSHTPLYGISRGFAETPRSTCQNICRVRAEYVQSTRKMGTWLWAPLERSKRSWYIIENYSKIQKQSFL